MKIPAYVITCILISAFIVLNYSSPHFYKLHRYGGQLLYLKALSIGAFCLAISYVISIYFPIIDIVASHLPDLKSPHISADTEKNIIFYSLPILLSLLYCSAYLIFRVIRLWCKIPGPHKFCDLLEKDRIQVIFNIICDSPLDRIFFESYMNEKFLIISMKDKKVYIGRVNILAEPNEYRPANQEISIVPILSGFREENTLKVHLINDYGSSSEPATIIIKQTEIISAAEFNQKLHEHLVNTGRIICKE
ncbi:TPA: hypothetical protein U0T37_000468 [Legionella pneumophila]|nr:hypothetical protein [Legionella pneumophila]